MDRIWKNGPTSAQRYISSRYSQKQLSSSRNDYRLTKEVSLERLQAIKEDWAKFVPEKAYKGKPITGAFNDIKDTAAGLAREKIYKALGDDVRQAYFDYGNLKGLQEMGQKALTGAGFKGGFGGFWTTVVNKGLTPTLTVGGKTIYRIGEGIEFIGKSGAKKLGELFNE